MFLKTTYFNCQVLLLVALDQVTNTIYIRGLASTTPAMTTAGVAGLSP